ncbi:MAG: YraN family protein [Oscillospiraceae bacterium]|nr:YraN family protein [Oscillospiraceae bacterium]
MNRGAERAALGALGERLASEHLERQGYRILERNFRCRMGEIDLIARRGGELVFAEVKLRKDASHGEAREFVTAAKQRKLLLTAEYYLSARPWAQDLQARFDVIEVYAPQGTEENCSVFQLENAFS